MCQFWKNSTRASIIGQACLTKSCRLVSARSCGVWWSLNSQRTVWRKAWGTGRRKGFNAKSASDRIQSRLTLVRRELADAELRADRSTVFAGEFMPLSIPPFLRALAFEVPGGCLPGFLHRGADGAQRLERGGRLGLLDGLHEVVIGPARFAFSAAEPRAERFIPDADVIAGVGAVGAEGEDGQDLLPELRREFRGPAAGFFLGHGFGIEFLGAARSLSGAAWPCGVRGGMSCYSEMSRRANAAR
jgi:hypothetical protein